MIFASSSANCIYYILGYVTINFIIFFSFLCPPFVGLDRALSGRLFAANVIASIVDGEGNNTTDAALIAANAQRISGNFAIMTFPFIPTY